MPRVFEVLEYAKWQGFDFVLISLHNILDFRKHNGEKPTLVFDLMGILQILNKDKEDMLYGRSHRKYYEIIENLFQR